MTYALYNPVTHVAVPKEPTPEMLVAMHEAWEHGHFDGFSQNIRRAAAAMLNAAPPHVVETAKLREEVIGIINLRGFGEAPLAGWVDYDRATARKADAVLKLLRVK